MSGVIDNEYKLQFCDVKLMEGLETALAYNIPIVDTSFLHRCIAQNCITSPKPSEKLAAVIDLIERRREQA